MLSRLLRRLQGRPASSTPAADEAVRVLDAATAASPGGVMDPHPDVATSDIQTRFLADLLDVRTLPATPGVAADVLARLDTMAAQLDIGRLPRLPVVVPQLMAALRRDDVDAASLAALLARDPTLSGDVLRVANSAHYRRGPRVSALPQAVNVIGADGLRYAVLTSVARPILQADPARQGAHLGERLSSHCESRTWLCGLLAQGACDPAEAQLASVIAATGTAALLRMLPRPLLVQAAADAGFAPAFFALAARLSARAAAHWHLGDALRNAIAAMGDPLEAAAPLGTILARADRLAMLEAIGDAPGLAAGPRTVGMDDAAGEPGTPTRDSVPAV